MGGVDRQLRPAAAAGKGGGDRRTVPRAQAAAQSKHKLSDRTVPQPDRASSIWEVCCLDQLAPMEFPTASGLYLSSGLN
jgi:hypothetical protein